MPASAWKNIFSYVSIIDDKALIVFDFLIYNKSYKELISFRRKALFISKFYNESKKIFCMKILFIGDISGSVGRKAVIRILPKLKKEKKVDLVIANAENSAHGSGATTQTIEELMTAGVDAMTMGDHAFARFKVSDIYDKYPIIRPANFPEGAPGKGYIIIPYKKDKNILLINLIGRVFMKLDYDCPFRKFDEILANINLPSNNIFAIIVDIHAECTSEKIAFKHYVAQRAAAVLGTHTHIMTADAEIKYPHVLPKKGRAIFNSVIVDINERDGKAKSIKPITKFINIE